MAEPFGLYPKLIYPTMTPDLYLTFRTLEPQYPLLSAIPEYQAVTQSALAPRGYRYSSTLRTEETIKVSLLLTPHEAQQFAQFLTLWPTESLAAGLGTGPKQFQFILDKRLGTHLTFQNTLYDSANNNTLIFGVEGPGWFGKIPNYSTYQEDAHFSTILQSGMACYLQSNSPGALGGHVTAFSGQTIIMHFNPYFSCVSASPAEYFYLYHTYRLTGVFDGILLYGVSQERVNIYTQNAAGSISYAMCYTASWAADGSARVGLAATVTPYGGLKLWMDIDGTLTWTDPASPHSTSAVVSGPITTLAASYTGIHNSWGGGYRAPMALHHFALYNWAFSDEEAITQLRSYTPGGRNLYDKAELVGTEHTFRPANPQGTLWILDLNIRQGI